MLVIDQFQVGAQGSERGVQFVGAIGGAIYPSLKPE